MKRESYFNRLLNAPVSSTAPVLRPPRALFRTTVGSVDLQMPTVTARPPARPGPDPSPQIPHIVKNPPQSAAAPSLEIAPVAAEAKQDQTVWQVSAMPEASAAPVITPETVAPEPSRPREPAQRAQPKSEIQTKPAAIETAPAVRSSMAEPALAAARRQTIASAEPSGGLRIGTLEVRVAAAPVAPSQTKPPKPPPSPRSAAPQSIARPFSACGLRQS
jgi:hypothetical protein